MGTIQFILNLYSSIKTVGATVLGALWALNKLALFRNLRNLHGQTDMARCTRLVILIKNTYIYIIESERLHSACNILSKELSIPFYSTSNGYNIG